MADSLELDNLNRMLRMQDDLQAQAYGLPLADLIRRDGVAPAVDAVLINVLAATDELHELLAETSWKPWASSTHLDIEAARSEWIDTWHFMMNLANLLGMDSAMILELYSAKRQKNIDRQAAGYDGVTTKCPGCGRALDDDAVACHFFNGRLGTDVEERLVFCDVGGHVFRPNKAKA